MSADRRLRCSLSFGLLLLAACGRPALPDAQHAVYVGSAACAECHAASAELVAGRAHNLAMRPARDANLGGRFKGATLLHFGTSSEFL